VETLWGNIAPVAARRKRAKGAQHVLALEELALGANAGEAPFLAHAWLHMPAKNDGVAEVGHRQILTEV
jgi:hypothetical protein